MSRVYIDTDKLEDDSKHIKEYVTKLDELLTKYVTRMLKVPNETKEWQGNSADYFMDIIRIIAIALLCIVVAFLFVQLFYLPKYIL